MPAETSINGNGKRLYRACIPGALRRHSFRTDICAFAKSLPPLFKEFEQLARFYDCCTYIIFLTLMGKT